MAAGVLRNAKMEPLERGRPQRTRRSISRLSNACRPIMHQLRGTLDRLNGILDVRTPFPLQVCLGGCLALSRPSGHLREAAASAGHIKSLRVAMPIRLPSYHRPHSCFDNNSQQAWRRRPEFRSISPAPDGAASRRQLEHSAVACRAAPNRRAEQIARPIDDDAGIGRAPVRATALGAKIVEHLVFRAFHAE